MAMTLVEAAKLHSGEVLRSSVIEQYARTSDILRELPFDNIAGNALRYTREDTLPGIAFRGVNEAYTESTGVLNPLVEPLVIAGGDLDVDKYIVTTMGTDQRTVQEMGKVKSLAHLWTSKFIKGDSSTDPRELDGLQNRIVGNQRIDAGATSGGDALSLLKLDELIDLVVEPTHLIMNKTMRRLMTAAARTTVGGFITYTVDAFGRQVATYAGLPILLADEDNAGNQILPFTEANPGGGTAASTSIYCVSFREGMLTGIQSSAPMVADLGELQTKPAMRTRIEWYAGVVCLHGKSAGRLRGIKSAAVVA
jgi:hypothetical protein